jgi:hypothetical protein
MVAHSHPRPTSPRGRREAAEQRVEAAREQIADLTALRTG